jgi:hypothetical protein
MSSDLRQELEALAADVLAACVRATELRELRVAEQLLLALEELSRSETELAVVDRA